MAPIALYVTICLWSPGALKHDTCHEAPLTPGIASMGFQTVAECVAKTDATISRWMEDAGPVFQFNTGLSGDDPKLGGYEIKDPRCGVYVPPGDPDDARDA